MRFIFLFLSVSIITSAVLVGQSTHKLIYSFRPERTVYKGDTLYTSRVFPAYLPGMQRIDSIAVNYGTFDTITLGNGFKFKSTYPVNKVKNDLILNVELFYQLKQSDFYAKSAQLNVFQKEETQRVVSQCFDQVSSIVAKENGLASFRQNLQQLIDSLPRPNTDQMSVEAVKDRYQDQLVDTSLEVARKHGLQATRVEGYLFSYGVMLANTWILVNDPHLGMITFDPFETWLYPEVNTLEDLSGYYLITESCLNDPLRGRWISQLNRKKKSLNPVERDVGGTDFLTAARSGAIEYYQAGELEEAKKIFGILSVLDPSHSTNMNFYAMIDARLGDFEQSSKKFKTVLENSFLTKRDRAATYYAYGNCLALQNKKTESVLYLAKVFELEPMFIPAKTMLEDEDLLLLRNYPPFFDLLRKLEKLQAH